jgi:flavin-dependent dehydrogenase
VGDAARFVNPIFSTGVSIALNSARFASQDIIRAAEKGDFRKQSFQRFETTIRRGMQNWYDLISIYYRLNMVFGMFVENEHYRKQIVKLTQGDVYDEDSPDVIGVMKEFIHEVEQNEQHPCHPFLGKLTSTAFSPAF